jgi:hypothetical protein
MQVELSRVLDLLRSRKNDKTAQRAARSLPSHVDLERDRDLIERCGIDPNVLGAILVAEERRVPSAERLSPQAAAVEARLDHAVAV